MKQIKTFILLLVLALAPWHAMAANGGKQGTLDIPEIVLEHLADSYEWHIATYQGKNLSIPLPIIIRSGATGEWHFCTASTLPKGFYFDAAHHGKIYEKMPGGTSERPIDLSITKDVLQIWIAVAVMLVVFGCCARWYRRHDELAEAPKGFVGAMELIVMTIHDDVVKSSIGEAQYRRFAPYLLTVFFFILTCNLVGLVPFFPGGANVTGNINITLFLAVCTMIAINLFGNREYWKEIFWPEVPTWLKVPVPMMPVIEFFGIFTKPFALMVRLFANIMGGHAIILSFTCVIFICGKMGGAISSLSGVSFLLMIFMDYLELLVAFIQAYVFTILSAVFIGLAHPEHHKE